MVVVGVVFVAGVVVVVDVSVAVVSVTASSDVVSGAFADATTVRATASVGSATAFVVVDALETVVAVAGVFTVVPSTAGSSAVSAALPNTFFFFNGLIIRSFLCADFCEKINNIINSFNLNQFYV